MLRIKTSSLNNYFKPLSQRQGNGIFFYRICGFDQNIDTFIKSYCSAAKTNGLIIEGKIQNPDEKNLNYYNEMLGSTFSMDKPFMENNMKKWMPCLPANIQSAIANETLNALTSLKNKGKSDSILKNCYIKFMCWLYYRFNRITNRLGSDNVPKIIYDGEISHHELLFLSIIANAGCDIILLEYNGDNNYLKYDPNSELSDKFPTPDLPFPQGFSLSNILKNAVVPPTPAKTVVRPPKPAAPSRPASEITATAMQTHAPQNRPVLEPTRAPTVDSVKGMQVPASRLTICTNDWDDKDHLENIMTPISNRNSTGNIICNMFTCIHGVWDKTTYESDLYQMYTDMKSKNKPCIIMNNSLPDPTPAEIGEIKRSNTLTMDAAIMELAKQIRYDFNTDLQNLMINAFVTLMKIVAEEPNISPGKLTTKATYLLCWLKRYTNDLFGNSWNTSKDTGCFIKMGACNKNEMLFMRYIAKLPVDVIILLPNKNTDLPDNDPNLKIRSFADSLQITKFPDNPAQLRVGTVAYHAERELDTLMYQDSGIYRDMQYSKANAITLRTMYEEVLQLWSQEPKFRPNFKTNNGIVDIPVLFAKISGVKDANESAYWSGIKQMITQDTIILRSDSIPKKFTASPDITNIAPKFFRNGKLAKDELINSPYFRYSYLRTDIINHMLDKLELLINSQIIKGTFDNGTEYVIIGTILNLPQDVIQHIQSFDFTKKNPNLIYIDTNQTIMTLEESIAIAYLNMIGFDIACFIPTGYQNIEKHFNDIPFDEHQLGQYMYDLRTPNLDASASIKNSFNSLKRKLFGSKH